MLSSTGVGSGVKWHPLGEWHGEVVDADVYCLGYASEWIF